jgi:hypothetical protein
VAVARDLTTRVPAELADRLAQAVEVLEHHAPIVAAALRTFAAAAQDAQQAMAVPADLSEAETAEVADDEHAEACDALGIDLGYVLADLVRDAHPDEHRLPRTYHSDALGDVTIPEE